ncbi:hypothetical protein D3C87_1167790 [compost metagenome]
MRFSKRIKVFPGFSLNVSKSGISSTIRVKGASINISKRGTYLNSSIPGTGISFRTKIANGKQPSSYNESNTLVETENQEEQVVFENQYEDQLTSTNLKELKDTLQEAYTDRIEISNEIQQTKKDLIRAKNNLLAARIFLIGFIFKSFKEKVSQKNDYLIDLEEQLKKAFVNIDIHFDENFQNSYQSLVSSYKSLLTSEKIWDITATFEHDSRAARSSATTLVKRVLVNFKFDSIDIIQSSNPAFHLENKNGGDLYIYPAFVISTTSNRQFSVIDIKDIKLTCHIQRFIEEDNIPSDSLILGKTWAKVNKDGSPDRRFTGNYEIPIVQYGEIRLKSSTGLDETYSFSSLEKAKDFVDSFNKYESLL